MILRHDHSGVVVTTVVGLTAAWAARNGALPGQSFPVLGPAVQGLLWACLSLALGLLYRRVAAGPDASTGSLATKIGCCLLLALLSAYLCARLMRLVVESVSWARLGYLGTLAPLGFVVLWCAALLPRETLALYRARRNHPRALAVAQLVVLFVSAAALIGATDLAFHASGKGPIAARLKADVITTTAWITNSVILFGAYGLVFAATARLTTALLLVSPLYAACALATLAKIKYMHTAIQPLDLLRFPEFVPLFHGFFGTTAVVVTGILLVLWIGALAVTRKERPSAMSTRARRSLALLSVAVLMLFPVAFALVPSLPALEALLVRAGAPDGLHRERARLNGLVLSFLAEIPATFATTPGSYSEAAVSRALAAHAGRGMPTTRDGERRVNLVVYLIESFMDPDDLGLRYTAEPIPNIRALRGRGAYAVVPEAFGGSANTEFEVLTGMTRSFLPNGSLPYRQYLRRPIPSLPSALGALGYRTVAIQADAKYYYDRERVYDLLGFQTTVWLADVPGVVRGRGRWPSDAAAVEEVMRVSRERRPFFAFVFPSSTHSPYHYGTYADSDLDVLDLPHGDGRRELKEYINAVREADKAVGTLIDYFRRWPEPTLVVVLGDHLPPLSGQALLPTGLSHVSETDRPRVLHRVPLVVWSNFEQPREERDISTNAIAPFVLERLGIHPAGFLGVVGEVHRKLPVLGSYVQSDDGRIWDRDVLPVELRAIVDDYRLLQYDLLLGEQYALGPAGRRKR
jgi:hypothetical protein